MSATLTDAVNEKTVVQNHYLKYILVFVAGLIATLGFSPFNLPGFMILSLAILLANILNASAKQSFLLGFIYGVAYFGSSVSWVIISIHDYGHVHYAFAFILTFSFMLFLALYPAVATYLFKKLRVEDKPLLAISSFSVIWCLVEIARSYLFTGFPWVLVGTTLIDTPARYLAPLIGINGLSLVCVFVAGLLVNFFYNRTIKRFFYLIASVLLLISPAVLKNMQWTTQNKEPISVAGIQANLSMRDKWDQDLFVKLLKNYEQAITSLLGKQLIILPESAIPLPASYLPDYFAMINEKARAANSAVILGILESKTGERNSMFYNTIMSLGLATGKHIKYQLVPFGEYIPKPFVAINKMLGLPQPDIIEGPYKQDLMQVSGHPIANLICWELAYPQLLRNQLPEAEWIVSINDNGWFGHSLASFQQLQMAQMLSLMTGRYQVLVNNDGLSSIIDTQGELVNSLPAFSGGILQGEVFASSGSTPWVKWGNYPVFIFCAVFVFFILILRLPFFRKK